ncbi:hypothetical protein HIM_01559 [Hirsutella minnesotensis 3608]|nr:hypothetical protein HIM_01559 [Hirsutella minnesotensis 3608]
MAISWDSARSLILFFGPILLPKAISYYRSVRTASRAHGLAVQPVPRQVRLALALLFLVAAVCLVKTLPPFAPENVFAATQSRLQIPVDVLFNRLAALRPAGSLGRRDLALRAKFINLESRLLYLQFGPGPLADCPFCNADEPRSYFYYALTDTLWPHLANTAVVALVTSPSWTGTHGSQWRTLSLMAAGALATLEVYLISSYDYQANARALRLQDVDMFFWSMRVYRLVALVALDALLGWLIYLSATNRAFVRPITPAERVDTAVRNLLSVKSKMSAMGIIKNTALRDEELRARCQAYWAHEVHLMREVMEERDVIEGINDALSNRIDMQTILRDADAYSQSVLQPLQQQMDSNGA